MATYTMLSNGSRGDEVKKLQTSLINAGYNVGSSGADGIYGSNTAAAVKKYQQDNGLDVDGIAGDQTLGKLYGSSTGNPATGSASGSAAGTTSISETTASSTTAVCSDSCSSCIPDSASASCMASAIHFLISKGFSKGS